MRLWNYYDGEPFMENPHVAIIGNPFKVGSVIERKKSGFRKIGQKKGKKVMAFRKARRNYGTKRGAARRRRHGRENPIPGAGLMFNPRRKHRKNARRSSKTHPKVYLSNRRRHRRNSPLMWNPRRKHRRNPAVLGVALPPINMIAWGAGGFIAPPMLEKFVNQWMPVSVTGSTLGRYAVKIGSVLALTYLVKTVLGNKEAFPVALGGSLYVVVSAVNEFAPQLTGATTTTTAAYRGGMINAYRNGMIASGIPTGYAGMGAYKQMGAGLPGLAKALPGLAYGPSAMIPDFNINYAGMANPVFADPRFAFGNSQPR